MKFKQTIIIKKLIENCVSSGLLPVNIKGSDRLCKVVELSMQCCGKLLSASFETYQTF